MLMYDIDWNTILHSISQQEGVSVTPDPSKWNLETPGYNEIVKLWDDANFNKESVEWINYYPGKHFDINVENGLAEYLKIKPIRSWISRVNPGYMTGWHWDVDDNEEQYQSLGNLVRYTCFIAKPNLGQVLIVGNQCYYSMPQCSLVKWDNYKEWHCGMNGGLKPKYLYHLLGYN